ncbi:MAG: hydroxylamine reductase [Candidatus Omnitrophica bacterium]|nr:hydroxylamine reductase [Candidatus Omnitrophota bacterium]
MFCNQCEQTAKGTGCTVKGVCGKNDEVAVLQDLLVHVLKGIAAEKKNSGKADPGTDRFLIEGLFSTVTNVNFDPERLVGLLKEALAFGRAPYGPEASRESLVRTGQGVGLLDDPDKDQDIRSLKEIYLYGLKGMAAYADHARILGKTDDAVSAYFTEALAHLAGSGAGVDDWVARVLELGKINLRCMEILDEAHTERFGHPVPTQVSLGVKKGPAILVSGHDLLDLEDLLKQTEGKGVSVYTHGEMLPAHGYPKLKAYPHLAGHYGGAWQDQAREFDQFAGAILMTTNCIQEPRESYRERIFTTGLVAWPGVVHIPGECGKRDFGLVIRKAIASEGFKADQPDKSITVGFGRNAVLSVAGKVVDAVKAGQIRHFFLVGGCDGAKSGRNYYTDFAQQIPKDCVILTLACGKFRFNKLDFGDIGGIPRLLDVGQCNDAYSAVQIASALAGAFECGINDLPLSLVLSWYEQKAVCILLTLLSLGVKGIRLGPSLPAFVSPNVLNVLVKNFDIKPIETPEKDLAAILGN